MRDLRDEIRARVAGAGLSPTQELEVVDELLQHCEDRREEVCAAGAGDAAATETVLRELDETGALARQLESILDAAPPPAPPLGADGPGSSARAPRTDCQTLHLEGWAKRRRNRTTSRSSRARARFTMRHGALRGTHVAAGRAL